jgi:hypothetical protein
MRRLRGVALAVAAAAVAARGEIPFERMTRQTVQLRVRITLSGGDRVGWGGSGYVIADGRHVVTNYHVCCEPAKPPQGWPPHIPFREESRTIEVAVEADQWVAAQPVWHSMKKDLGIVRIERDSGRPPVTFAPRSLCYAGQEVYALGFPGASNTMTDEAGRNEVKIANGIISAMLRTDPKRPGILSGIRVYQSNITTNPGNSGGPVFDQCGRVVATHSASHRAADGVKWEVQADELLEELPALGLKVEIADSRCALEGGGSRGRDFWDYLLIAGQIATGLLALAAIALAATRRGRNYVKNVTTSYRRSSPRAPVAGKGRPVLKGVSGYYAGTVLELESGAFTLGRDARASNLVFPPETGNISRRHCTVHYDEALNRFLLEDTWSTNGTYLDNGEQVTPGQPHELKAGERFYLGSRDNTFEVSLEEGR